MLDDGPATAVSAAHAAGGVRLVLQEGRKRQVRRMLKAVGYEVSRLLRLRIDGLRLGDLQPGQWRRRSGAEIDRLKHRRAGRRVYFRRHVEMRGGNECNIIRSQ